jgi:hypothetical protein
MTHNGLIEKRPHSKSRRSLTMPLKLLVAPSVSSIHEGPSPGLPGQLFTMMEVAVRLGCQVDDVKECELRVKEGTKR